MGIAVRSDDGVKLLVDSADNLQVPSSETTWVGEGFWLLAMLIPSGALLE